MHLLYKKQLQENPNKCSSIYKNQIKEKPLISERFFFVPTAVT